MWMRTGHDGLREARVEVRGWRWRRRWVSKVDEMGEGRGNREQIEVGVVCRRGERDEIAEAGRGREQLAALSVDFCLNFFVSNRSVRLAPISLFTSASLFHWRPLCAHVRLEKITIFLHQTSKSRCSSALLMTHITL